MVEHQPEKMWIMGGWTTDTSYLFGKPEGMSQGPDLPLALEGACALAINNSQTSLVGGHDGDSYSRAAFIYDWTNSEWTEVSSMDQPRRLYTGGCGSFTDPASGDIKMVVIGGQGNNGTTTEIYNLANDEWCYGPDYPLGGVYDVSAVQDEQGSFYVRLWLCRCHLPF